ncbi:MAG: hypothetical protein JJLCMIEE_00739 [Acidimicrobiales bacterium]|nr:MAG: hypothetical protein EDR02_02710 [Actinomycetota bacterium]MBV6507684.1 hypothetical protein [Acidimicrobiales bacterium]RIK07613.1 MAG: hypothetical protein DCC48_03720 [Acidobacteriota bacterium]
MNHQSRIKSGTRLLVTLAATLVLVVTACSSEEEGESDPALTGGPSDESVVEGGAGDQSDTDGEPAPIVFNGQDNDLVVYSSEPPFESQRLISSALKDPQNGLDINAQICFFPDENWFIAGEDTNQPNPPAGWGIFALEGDTVGQLEATQIGKLTPTYQPGDQGENYGCGILSDGRVVTVDVGNQALGPATGQLIIWFPPFDSRAVAYCKLDVELGTGQSVLVDEQDNIYVAAARPGTAGVYRYSPPYPTAADADGGCGQTDATGAPLADEVDKEIFIPADEQLATPSGLAWTADGGMYVSSVFTGVINEYDSDGAYVRTILEPPEGEVIAEAPYSTGTPLGLGVDRQGVLYYADIGLVQLPGELPGPGVGTGSVRRIVFSDGEPQAPEVMAAGLQYPDGIGIFDPATG